MLIAADYPFIDVLWSMIIFFFGGNWILIVVTVLIDVFLRDDIGGWAKGGLGDARGRTAVGRSLDPLDRPARRERERRVNEVQAQKQALEQ
jgi:hypothetical protein